MKCCARWTRANWRCSTRWPRRRTGSRAATSYVAPRLTKVAANEAFPKGVTEQRPWYRTTPQPDLPV